MNMEFLRKLPVPQEIKERFPLTDELKTIKQQRDEELKQILSGQEDKLILVIGPCSADRSDAVLDYVNRLAKVQKQVEEKIFIIPRIYTNKPRTTGLGYKGMANQPDPEKEEDLLEGLLAIRKLHTDAMIQTGFTCADEMLYPENHRYLSDILGYVAIGARSVENQQHRLTASGLDIPVGIKNPTSGDNSVMLNSIIAAQASHKFLYRGWECKTHGNPFAHAILRGYVDNRGVSKPNYHYEDLCEVYNSYSAKNLENMAVIVDTNHANSGKNPLEQVRICKEVMHSRKMNENIKNMVKGFMIESYIEDGAQKIGEGVYGKSITDGCLGWTKSENLIFELADML